MDERDVVRLKFDLEEALRRVARPPAVPSVWGERLRELGAAAAPALAGIGRAIGRLRR